ncbi:minor tail protein [Mycobacterium phage Rem711]|uniref:Minor tail protein n=1 Tax=Mycobacterium phage Rem711 TaxID=2079285 RepID=A0A2K9VEU9_9CAUD|nr:minor tail protein [Mycobacterium phage Rem711]AUV60806.1 minor tail protein [Mycobacterium phage Rem711]
MPKAVDRYPQSRGVGNSLYNPLRSGIQGWTDPLGAIDEAAERAGQGIRQRLEDGLDQVLDGVVDTIFNVTGIDLSGPVELLEQLLGVPLAFLDSASLGTAIDVLGQFFPFLAGANADDFDPLEAAAAFINARLSPTGLLASWSALYHEITGEVDGALDDLGELLQHGLFGQIAAGRLGQISAASIDNLNPETLDNPGFDTDASIRDNSEVEWDGTFGRTRPGSMKIVADGTTKTAVSNPLRVVQNREVNVSIWTYYTGVTANPGTTPIRLSVAAYADAPVASDPPVWIADTLIPATAIASPAGDSSDVAGNVDGWVLISGSYTVPAGVDLIVNKVQVTDDCLAGEVHFDDGSRKRAGMLPKEYVEGLIAELTEHAEKIRQTINKAWEALTDLPATVDKTVDDLKNALKSIPQGNIQNFAAALNGAGQDIRDAIVNALGGTGTGHNAAAVIAALQNIPQDAIDGLEDELADLGDGVADALENFVELANGVLSGSWNPASSIAGLIGSLFGTKQKTNQIVEDVAAGWAGTTPTGTPTSVFDTMAAVRDAVLAGYTVSTFTSSTTNWARPTDLVEMVAIVVGGGQNGQAGINNTGTSVRPGGLHGSYLAQALDVATLPAAFDIAVGTAGQRSYVREANATPHAGAVIVESPAQGSPGGIATAFGLSLTSSAPGNGGAGGMAYNSDDPPTGHSATAGAAGDPSGLAAGGTGGSAAPGGSNAGARGGDGGPGGSVSAGALTKCGGGGGGGGGGGRNFSFTGGSGGNGGAGGYPGGAGGSGGNGSGVLGGTAGSAGPGAPGVVWLFYR